jgi:hypothetical protein
MTNLCDFKDKVPVLDFRRIHLRKRYEKVCADLKIRAFLLTNSPQC